jgi:hypothetical protein
MWRKSLWLAVLGLIGCQEYNLQTQKKVVGTPNPPDLMVPVQQDRIVQVTVPSVDVLWVIDNSCSMAEEQESLAENFPKFMDYFVGSGLDYHVGVVSTDMDNPNHRGKLRHAGGVNYIDDTVADPMPIFSQMASMGTDGSSFEKGLAATYSAMVTLKDTDNAGFARDSAHMSIVVISDEDDSSSTSVISISEFVSWLQTTKSAEDMVTFSSIVGIEPSGCSGPGGDATYGERYVYVTDQVGGIKWSICNSAWDQVLMELGMQAAGLKREFYLSLVPFEPSIDVWVEEDGEEVGEDATWVYDQSRNSITFESYVPNPLAEVFIEYQILAAYDEPDEDEEPEDTADSGL